MNVSALVYTGLLKIGREALDIMLSYISYVLEKARKKKKKNVKPKKIMLQKKNKQKQTNKQTKNT